MVTVIIVFIEAVGIALADDDTIKLPLIFENVLTTNPVSGAIDAVAEPLAILLILNDKADSGIFVNPSPLPLKKDAPDTAFITP